MTTLIIAEAGVNHNGSIDLALKLIDAAVEAQADIIKFQSFKAELLTTAYAKKAEYQIRNTDINGNQQSMLQSLELTDNMHSILIDYCNQKNIAFLSTAFDLTSLDYLYNHNIGKVKIPSGEITNLPYIEKVGRLLKPTILSTGMSTIGEIEKALDVLLEQGLQRNMITILHCNTEYPTPYDDVNLKAMVNIGNALGVNYGYSDHTLGIEIPIAAVALGASIIEKHLTLDRNLEGPDHKASLEPSQFKDMVIAIRNIEKSLGDGIKRVTNSERKNKTIARKSIVAASAIAKGDVFTEKNLTTKRPGGGISPMLWHEILGNCALKDYKKDEMIEL